MTEPPSARRRDCWNGNLRPETSGKGDDWEVNLSAYFNKTADNANGHYDYESLSGQLESDSRDRSVDAFGKRQRIEFRIRRQTGHFGRAFSKEWAVSGV